jgi:hypothetical protein
MWRHKYKDSWSFIGKASIKNTEDVLIDLTGWSIKSQLRKTDGSLIVTFDCSWVDPVQQTYLHQCLKTCSWPSNTECRLDIQFTSPSGFVISTPTLVVFVEKDVTS